MHADNFHSGLIQLQYPPRNFIELLIFGKNCLLSVALCSLTVNNTDLGIYGSASFAPKILRHFETYP